MSGTDTWLEALAAALLVAGMLYAAVKDVRTREVTDRLWQLLGGAGVGIGAVVVATGGLVPLAAWAIVAALALEHLFPWDEALGKASDASLAAIEVGAFAAAIVGVGYAAYRWGFGPSGVPVAAVAVLVTVVLARGLFELRVLYGGADAKAVLVAGVLVPVFSTTVIPLAGVARGAVGVLPFSITLLTDAALLSIAVPIALAVRNAARGEFSMPYGFSRYTLPVEELPDRFVWVRDPAIGEDTFVTDEAESSEEDRERRRQLADRLRARGVRRVWVSPQLPFVVLLTAGVVAGLLVGNLLLDLLTVL